MLGASAVGQVLARLAHAVGYRVTAACKAEDVSGVLEALEQLSQRYAVYVVTARVLRRVQFAQEWLEAHEVARHMNAVLSSANTGKEAVCLEHGISVLVDDDERHLAALQSRALRPLLFKPGYDENCSSLGALRVYRTWQEVTDALAIS